MSISARTAGVAAAVTAFGLLAVPAVGLSTGADAGSRTVVTSGRSAAQARGWSADGSGGPGGGMGEGARSGAGHGMHAATGGGGSDAVERGACSAGLSGESLTLTSSQQATLAAMAEEEKLAHDVYVTLADRYDVAVFDRITAAESRHLAIMRDLLDAYGLDDPTAGRAAGSFATASVQELYDRLVAQGEQSLDAAYAVGRTVETTDIADLEAALAALPDGGNGSDVGAGYRALLAGSQHHLRAFGG
jgi:hypothetical protein